MGAVIREMTKTDTDRVGEILFQAFTSGARKHGYPQKMHEVDSAKSWAWALLHHSGSEVLIAEVEDRVAGICCLNPRGNLGGVGPVAVDPSFQGFRIASCLMEALLKRAADLLSLRLIQEAFNPAAFSLYYAREFMPVATLLDVYRPEGENPALMPCPGISELTTEEIAALQEYDSPRSGSDRRADFAYFVRWGKVFVLRSRDEIRGFLVCLPGSVSVQMGPLVADGEEEAASLFRHATAVYRDRLCQTRVMARDHGLVRALLESGYKIYCLDNLMVRGAWRPGPHIEAFGTFPEGV